MAEKSSVRTGRIRPSPSRAEGPRTGAGSRAGALDAALSALSRRQRTASEIRTLLARKGYPRPEIDAAVARLEELRYVDDLAYAAAFAGTVARTKSWGPRRVRQELARRGVSAGTIEAGMAKAGEEGASPSGNIEAALAKLTRRGLPAERRGRDRIRAALARRGFESAEISRAIEALGAAGPDGEPGDDETGDDA